MEEVLFTSCFPVSMEMTVMREYIHGEGGNRKAFIEVRGLFCVIPINVFPMDEDCIGVAITSLVSVIFQALLYIVTNGKT
jgi:hypothetical protein